MKYKNETAMLKNTLLKEGKYKSTKEMFERVARMYPQKQVLAELDQNRNIVYYTASDVLNTIENLGDGLLSLGLADKHIAIMADNSYRYLITDVTIIGGVGVITPIDKDAPKELATKLLNQCDADCIICAFHLIDKIKEILPDCPNVKTVITIDKKVDGFLCYDEVVALGQKPENAGVYKNKELDVNKTSLILFTSGTTGANKAVELTQKNLSANMTNCLETIKGSSKHNTSMSILPMHHATEIYTHILPRIGAGRLTYINGSMKDMMTNIKIFKPYIITVVPMVANAFYHNIWAQAKKQGKEEKLKKGIKLCKLLSKFNIDITHKLFKDLYAPFGGNLEQIVCGGAPLNPEVVKGLKDLGIYIVNGYGITECGPLVSMNTDTVGHYDSVGRACPGLAVKLDGMDADGVGELCVKGDSVSKGYYKDPESTKLVHDADGYFHTGDLARQDKHGNLFLAGRKKNLIVLENGKNVYPEELEQEIVNSIKAVKEVMVFEGEYVVGNVTKRAICAEVFMGDNKMTDEELKLAFRQLNQNLPMYKRIGYVDVLNTEFDKNASKKILRNPALARHSKTDGIIL